ncbi:MAG: TetR/AcrR family transcriptional regulator [Elainellaceae cyanobacterium]
MPKIVDHDSYRKELLSQCFDLFAEKGYAALTMRQIAQGLGVSTGTLYHYFPNKEMLFEQMVREMTLQDIQNAGVEIKKQTTTLDRIEAVFRFIEAHEDYFIKQTLIWVEFYQQQKREDGDRITIFQEIWKGNEQEISNLLGIRDQALLDFLCCSIDGMLLHRMFDRDKFSFQTQMQFLIQIIKPYLEKI